MVDLRKFASRLTRVFAEPSLPADLAGEIATTRDGRDITRPFVQELEQPRDRRLLGVVDWGIYERVRRDDQVKSCMQQRISAVVSRDWDVLPGDDKDARSVAAAEATVTKGAGLLAVYSAGLGIPFLLAAFMVEQFSSVFGRMKRHLETVEKVMGALMVLTGVAFLTGSISWVSIWLLDTFPALANFG